MDRPIDPVFRRKQIVKRTVRLTLAGGLLTGAFVFGPGWIEPSVNKNRIRTAVVDSGSVEATLSASGTALPEFEQLLSSPIDTRVLRVLKLPGTALKKGEPILELDVGESRLVLERLEEQVMRKENEREQVNLDLETRLTGLRGQTEAKKLRIEFLKSKAEQQRKLVKIGGASREQLHQAELEQNLEEVELAQLQSSTLNAEKILQAKLDGLSQEVKIMQKEREEARRQLELATARADRDGVLTWVILQEGAAVRKGDVLARIANLSSFRVEATLSDVHASRLSVGMPVKVKVNEDYLLGRVARVLPTVENGVVTLLVNLDDKSNPVLRSQLRVDVFVVADRRDRTLRIQKGPFFNGEGDQEIFVIRKGRAFKTPVRLGISNFDYCEILEGLAKGDEVIISDMKDYGHLKELKVK